ncbi:pickpocket protein 28-like [Onthophagus taurus]|uniref:pickpocket protein 28-like n=1 Tax=Onthophagus taurus TaxID=166361 RepID=UPI0039BE3532
MFKKSGRKIPVYEKIVKYTIMCLKNCIKNFFKNSNLHGCRYITDTGNGVIASICWAIILFTSVLFCITLIIIQLKRFQETTILNSIATTGYPVWKTPFPTVIICNNNIVYKTNSERVKKLILSKGFPEEDIDAFFEHLAALVVCHDCDDNKSLYNNSMDVKIFSALEDFNYDINELMMELAHPCGRMIKKCYWKSDLKNCDRLFKSIKTSLGYCCAFNYFATVDVQYENYEKQLQYSGGFGLGSGLQVVVNVEPSEYVSSVKTATGVEVINNDYIKKL